MAVIVQGKNPKRPFTVRYQQDGRQRERSFPGPTSQQADDFILALEYAKRAGTETFAPAARSKETFAAAAATWLSHLSGAPSSKVTYQKNLRLHILPAFGRRTLLSVAGDRDGVAAFLTATLKNAGAGVSVRKSCYIIIRAVCNDAVKSGRLASHRLAGIAMPAVSQRAEFTFPGHAELVTLAAHLDTFPRNGGCVFD
jgi:hypothetical protein